MEYVVTAQILSPDLNNFSVLYCCLFSEKYIPLRLKEYKKLTVMAQITIQMPSQDRLNLLEELVIQLGGTIVQSAKKAISHVKVKEQDLTFGAWANMEKTTEEICKEIRNERHFGERKIAL